MMRIRRIDLCDARLFWDVQKQLDTESKFMMLEPEERRFDFSRTIGRISRFDFLVGAVVGIIEEFQHQGIGSQLFEELERWAKEKAVKRLELTVMINNYAAIALFQKHGFTIEGVRREAVCVDGKYIDEFYMSKILD